MNYDFAPIGRVITVLLIGTALCLYFVGRGSKNEIQTHKRLQPSRIQVDIKNKVADTTFVYQLP